MRCLLLSCLVVLAGLATPALASICTPSPDNSIVEFELEFGSGGDRSLFRVELCAADTPLTVENFLSYVADGSYTDSGFVHRRSFLPSLLQGGGYYVDERGRNQEVDEKDPVDLEVGRGLRNWAGTHAMARTVNPNNPDDPRALNSATSQWYVNVSDNLLLDTELGGFAVFGEVIEGFDVVERAALPPEDVWSFPRTPFGELPLIDYEPGSSASVAQHLIYVRRIEVVPEAGPASAAAAALATLVVLGWPLRSPLRS